MENVCPQLHCLGWIVYPKKGLESSLALPWAARSQELPRAFSKLHLGRNSTDWAAAGVTGRLSQAGHRWRAGWDSRSCCMCCSHCSDLDATEYLPIWSMGELDGLESLVFLLGWLVCYPAGCYRNW